jgi:hypothetical protein
VTRDWVNGVLLVLLSAIAYAVYLISIQKIIGRPGAKRYTRSLGSVAGRSQRRGRRMQRHMGRG